MLMHSSQAAAAEHPDTAERTRSTEMGGSIVAEVWHTMFGHAQDLVPSSALLQHHNGRLPGEYVSGVAFWVHSCSVSSASSPFFHAAGALWRRVQFCRCSGLQWWVGGTGRRRAV